MPAQRIFTTEPSISTQLLLFSTLTPEVEKVTTGVEPVEAIEDEEVVTPVVLEVAVAEDVASVSLEVTSAALEEEATVK